MMEYGNDNLDLFGDELPGEFYLIKTVQMDFFGIMTKAAMEREITKGNVMPPSGHLSILKSHKIGDITEHTVIIHGGLIYEQGITWSLSSDLLAIHMKATQTGLEITDVTDIKPFSTTSPSGDQYMDHCSAMFGVTNTTMVDIKDITNI